MDIQIWGVAASPIYGTDVHAQHHALLCVLTADGGDHHHVAGHLNVGAFQTNRLEQEKQNKPMTPQLVDNRNTVCVFQTVSCVPTSLMLSSGLSRVNMVCRCCWMSPGRKTNTIRRTVPL